VRSTRLRGRDEELALIAARLDGAASGRDATILVEGTPGSGKTGLLREAAAMAGRRGMRAGTAAAAVGDQVGHMGPLLTALFDGPRPPLDPAGLAALHDLPEQRHWLVEDLASQLERAAMAGPVLVCLDDVQWADPATLAALRRLPGRLAGLPVVWLVAFRSGSPRTALHSTRDTLYDGGAVGLTLEPLAADVVAEIVTDLVGAPPDAALRRLTERAHGSPFLLVELVAGLVEESLVTLDAGVARLVEDRVPARLQQGMRERLRRHSRMARRVASTAVALGRTFTFDQLATMLDVTPTALLEPVEELLAGDLLVETGGVLAYQHDLVRDAVQDTLPASALRALQRQGVDALLRCGASPVEVAAQLAESAEHGDETAVRALVQAARSLTGSDPGTAADLGLQALRLARDDDPLRGPLVVETTMLLHAAGRSGEGKAFADALLRRTLSADEEADVRLSIANMIGVSPDVRADASRQALTLAELAAPVRARLFASLVHSEVMAGRRFSAGQLLPAARSAVAATDDTLARFALDLAVGGLAYAGGDFARSLELISAAGRSTAAHREPARWVLARQWRTEVLAVLDRYDESLPVIAESQGHAQRDRQEMGVRLWGMGRGRALLQVGRLVDATAILEGVLDDAEDGALVGVLDAAAVVALGRAAIHTGNRGQVQRCVAMCRTLLDTGTAAIRRYATWLLALEAMAAGDPTAARTHLRAVGGVAGLVEEPLLIADVTDEVHLVRLALATDERDAVPAALAAARERQERNPDVASIAGCAAHCRALVTDDADAFATAIGHFERGPRPLALASALEDAGRAARDRDPAVAHLDRALRLYVDAGASWDAGRVRGRLAALGVRRRLTAVPRPDRGWPALTGSELAVVRQVVGGMTNREIAEHLFLSPHTVSSHVRHAFVKLGIHSRMELAKAAAEHDIA
jgi:DNA-binding CsgD family transcriptional regulator